MKTRRAAEQEKRPARTEAKQRQSHSCAERGWFHWVWKDHAAMAGVQALEKGCPKLPAPPASSPWPICLCPQPDGPLPSSIPEKLTSKNLQIFCQWLHVGSVSRRQAWAGCQRTGSEKGQSIVSTLLWPHVCHRLHRTRLHLLLDSPSFTASALTGHLQEILLLVPLQAITLVLSTGSLSNRFLMWKKQMFCFFLIIRGSISNHCPTWTHFPLEKKKRRRITILFL